MWPHPEACGLGSRAALDVKQPSRGGAQQSERRKCTLRLAAIKEVDLRIPEKRLRFFATKQFLRGVSSAAMASK